MVFVTWLRGSRIADGSGEGVQALLPKPFLEPQIAPRNASSRTCSPPKVAVQSASDVSVDLAELQRGVPGAEVVPPSTKHGVEVGHDDPDIPNPAAIGAGEVVYPLANTLHSPW